MQHLTKDFNALSSSVRVLAPLFEGRILKLTPILLRSHNLHLTVTWIADKLVPVFAPPSSRGLHVPRVAVDHVTIDFRLSTEPLQVFDIRTAYKPFRQSHELHGGVVSSVSHAT
jgi:hypothetical protein